MDNLAREAMLARQAGMTYGKWKALQPTVKIEKQEIQDGWRPCEYCGKPFKRKSGKRFCDIGCRNQAYESKLREKRNEQTWKYRENHGYE